MLNLVYKALPHNTQIKREKKSNSSTPSSEIISNLCQVKIEGCLAQNFFFHSFMTTDSILVNNDTPHKSICLMIFLKIFLKLIFFTLVMLQNFLKICKFISSK